MTRLALLIALVAALAAPVAAQTGTLSGQITDETGAVLPGVEVRATLRDSSGESTHSVLTDGSGKYRISELTSGEWILNASVPGFETAVNRQTVQVGDALDWSPTLRIGSVQETVTITAGPTNEPVRSETPRPPDVAPAPPVRPAIDQPAGLVRVGGSIKPPRKIVDVRAIYPPDAAAQGIAGVVILEAIIGTDGIVREIRTLRSPADSLATAATNAFAGWEFTPTLLNGTPVDTRITTTFNFSQQQ